MSLRSTDARFLTTRWSLVVASRKLDDPVARAALATLCETYWYPLYAFLRRKGQGPQEAADLVQGFFASLLEREDIGRADPERGSFRTFLLTALTRYCANEHAARGTLKRGGAVRITSLEGEQERDSAERRYALEPVDTQSPERLFEAAWARELLGRVLVHLEEDELAHGRGAAFSLFAPRLFGDSDALPLKEVAQRLGCSEGACKVALHRLRDRFRTLLLGEVTGTLADERGTEAEIGALLAALAPGRA